MLILPFILSIVAIALGASAKKRIARSGEAGDGMATAGLVLGIISLVGYGLVIAFIAMLGLGAWSLTST
jgi:hypothetical protein